MKRVLIVASLFLLAPAADAQSNQDEYEIGETGAPKDYDPAQHKPKDYDASKDSPKDYDPSKDRPKDYDPVRNKPSDYDATVARPHDYDAETDASKDYDPDYVEGIIWEPGAREAYKARQDKKSRPRPEPYGRR